MGLELSQQRFIWVVVRSTQMPSDASASATFFNVGSDLNDPKAYLPEGFMDRLKERGRGGCTITGNSPPSVDGWIFISLWLELVIGEHNSRHANDRMAALFRADNEC